MHWNETSVEIEDSIALLERVNWTLGQSNRKSDGDFCACGFPLCQWVFSQTSFSLTFFSGHSVTDPEPISTLRTVARIYLFEI